MKINYKLLLYCIFMVAGTAIFCSIFTMPGVKGWYSEIAKPKLTPPNYIFPIAWNLIYLTLIYAFYHVINDSSGVIKAKSKLLFLKQLFLQIAWCFVFFAHQQFSLAVAIIALLDILAIQTIILFWNLKKTAAYALIPYILWLLFASYLNFSFIQTYGYALKI